MLRTFEGITSNFDKWMQDTRGDREKLKNFYNCQGSPLPIFPTSGLVSDHIPLPELHIMMGVTNKVVDELMKVSYKLTILFSMGRGESHGMPVYT